MAIVIFCFMNVIPHWLYGAGQDALQLTLEHESDYLGASNGSEQLSNELLCTKADGKGADCIIGEGNWAPQIILFVAQLISGIGQTLYYTLGTTYMDDNMLKKNSAKYLSISYFMRLIGPALGYTMGSFFLRIFIEPSMTPTITNNDPRWLGAWWVGWLVLGSLLLVSAPFLGKFG